MKYQILQIRITDAEEDLINETGDYRAVPKFKAQMDMRFPRANGIVTMAAEAYEAGYYDHVANITASDLQHVFEISNLGNQEDRVERLERMHSVSVGDIIIDENNIVWVVANFGFEEVMELGEAA